ncbi:hypothetical protein TNCV_4926021 [Trichonephila clavipes]|nr:hypothetical protein TNCV_4926021 [Trichonephila clavipes]
MTPRSLKCGNSHKTQNCQITERLQTLHCINCNEDKTSNKSPNEKVKTTWNQLKFENLATYINELQNLIQVSEIFRALEDMAKAKMYYMYGRANNNDIAALRMYHAQFPNRRMSDHRISSGHIVNFVKHVHSTSSDMMLVEEELYLAPA